MKYMEISTGVAGRAMRISMRSVVSVVSAIVVSSMLAAQAPAVPQPSPDHQKLAVFLGKWSFDGQAQASPYGPSGGITSTDTFAWLPGNLFMEHHWDVNQGGKSIVGMEILGDESASKWYTSQFFDNSGES